MDKHDEVYPKTNCLALTVRKEHRLMVINKITRKNSFICLFINSCKYYGLIIYMEKVR